MTESRNECMKKQIEKPHYSKASRFVFKFEKYKNMDVIIILRFFRFVVSVQYKDIGGVVIDKQHAMIAAVAAVLSGIAAFAVRHHQEF